MAGNPTYSYNPDDYGATVGMRSGTDDSSAVWNALFAQVRIDAAAGQINKPIDASGGQWRIITSINATGINHDFNPARSSFCLKSGVFVGECIGYPILDLTNSIAWSIEDTVFQGSSDPTKTPMEAIQVAPTTANCGNWKMRNVHIIGSYVQTGFLGYGYESCVMEGCIFDNDLATAEIFVGEAFPSHTYSALYATPSAGAVSFTNNTYVGCVFQPIGPSARVITGITRANPAVVTLSAPPAFINGSSVVINQVSGMTQVNNQKFTVAGISGNTFQLQGIDSSAYTAYSSGGFVFQAQQKSTLYLNGPSNQQFLNCYVVNYGSDAVEINEVNTNGNSHANNVYDFQIETFGSRSDYRINIGANFRVYTSIRITGSSSSLTAVITTDATSGILMRNPEISIDSIFGPNATLPLLGTPSQFTMYGMDVSYPIGSGFDVTQLAACAGWVTYYDTNTTAYYRK